MVSTHRTETREEHAPSSTQPASRSHRGAIAVLALIAGFVFFYELGDFRSLGSHEVFAAVPAREMLDTGNWIVPRFGGIPRLKKPPLAYWVVAASSWLCGQVSDWSVRLPAAVAAITLVLVIGRWAGKWYGRTAGLAAALVQTTSIYVIIFSRKAEVDMLLCLLTTTALFLFAGSIDDDSPRRNFWRWTGIYAALSLAWLAKFHYGPSMVLLPIMLFLLVQSRPRALRHMANPLGLILFVAAVGIWPMLLLEQVPDALDVWRQETVGRAVGGLGYRSILFYFPHLVWMTLPWTFVAIWASRKSFREAWLAGPRREKFFRWNIWKEGDPRERFLWVWFLSNFLLVNAQADKHPHYLMSLLPVFSLLAGRGLAELCAAVAAGRQLLSRNVAIAVCGVCAASAATVSMGSSLLRPALVGPVIAVMALLAAGGCVMTLLFVRRKFQAAGLTATVVFLGCYAGVTGWVMPGFDHRLPAAAFAMQMRSEHGRESIGVFRLGTDAAVYYLDEPVYRAETLEVVAARLQSERELLLLTYDYLADDLNTLGRKQVVAQMEAAHGAAASKRAPLILVRLCADDANSPIAAGRDRSAR